MAETLARKTPRHRGPVGRLVRNIAARGARLLSDEITDVVLVCDLDEMSPLTIEHSALAEIEIRPFTQDDLRLHASELPPREDLAQRLAASGGAQGDFGLIAVKQGRFAAFAWGTGGPRMGEGAAPFQYDIVPRSGYAYLYDMFILSEYRALGLGTCLMYQIMRESRARGFRRAFHTTDVNNIAVRRFSSRLGYKEVGEVHYRCRFGWETTDLAALVPHGLRNSGAGDEG